MSCLLSVIIPAYNSGEFIKRCIGGVLKCPIAEIEVVVVNDGSTDNTESIVKELINNDPRINLYSQHNRGVSSARNVGLSFAEGEYVIFSDADDLLEGENLPSLLKYAVNNNADIVAFGRINHCINGNTVKLIPKGETVSANSDLESVLNMTVLNQNNYGWSSCNKLFKRSVISANNISFVNYNEVNSEDRLFNLACLVNASIVAFFDKCSFHNFQRADSLSHLSDFPNASKRNINSFKYVCKYSETLPDNVRFKLLRHYFISFINNVAVLELSVNRTGLKDASKSITETYNGMLNVLVDFSADDNFRKEKEVFLGTGGTKYKLLNSFLLNKKQLGLCKAVLLGYVFVTDKIRKLIKVGKR